MAKKKPEIILDESVERMLQLHAKLSNKATTRNKTEKWLALHSWWWRYLPEDVVNNRMLQTNFGLDAETQDKVRTILDLFQSRVVFMYEFLMRHHFHDLIPLPWVNFEPPFTFPINTGSTKHQEEVELDESRLNFFHNPCLINTRWQPIITEAHSPVEWFSQLTAEDGYKHFTDYCKLAFNLKNSDPQISEIFLNYFIKPQREDKSIPNPAKQSDGTGKPRRAMSWKPIEFLDIERLKIRPLNEAERSQLSKARNAVISDLKKITDHVATGSQTLTPTSRVNSFVQDVTTGKMVAIENLLQSSKDAVLPRKKQGVTLKIGEEVNINGGRFTIEGMNINYVMLRGGPDPKKGGHNKMVIS